MRVYSNKLESILISIYIWRYYWRILMQLGAKEDIEEDKGGEVEHDVDQGSSLKQVYASFAQWRHHSGRLRSRERKRPSAEPRRATHAGYEERWGRRETRREAGTAIAKPNRFAVSRRVTAVAARIRVVLLSSWWWSRLIGHLSRPSPVRQLAC